MTNDALFGSKCRDCYPTTSATTYFWHRRRHYFSLNEWPAVARAQIWETQNYVGFILTDESLLSSWPPYSTLPSSAVLHLSLFHPPLDDPLVPCASNDPSWACNFHPEMARVVQLDNDNKNNSDKNNCYSNEKNHGAGSDLAYCKRLPLSLSTTWKMIILLISRSYLKFLRFKCRKIKRAEYLKKKPNGLYMKAEFFLVCIYIYICNLLYNIAFYNISRSFCASIEFKKPTQTSSVFLCLINITHQIILVSVRII